MRTIKYLTHLALIFRNLDTGIIYNIDIQSSENEEKFEQRILAASDY